jgi:hypothetical protein
MLTLSYPVSLQTCSTIAGRSYIASSLIVQSVGDQHRPEKGCVQSPVQVNTTGTPLQLVSSFKYAVDFHFNPAISRPTGPDTVVTPTSRSE